jgi:hypothetical protein
MIVIEGFNCSELSWRKAGKQKGKKSKDGTLSRLRVIDRT